MKSTELIDAVVEGHSAEDVVLYQLREADGKKHTVWRFIPKTWQDMFEKKKVKLKSGQDEVVTMYPNDGEVSVGKGMFKVKTIEPGRAEVKKFIKGMDTSKVW